jgi:hypothetical protein
MKNIVVPQELLNKVLKLLAYLEEEPISKAEIITLADDIHEIIDDKIDTILAREEYRKNHGLE